MITIRERQKILCKRYGLNAAEAMAYAASENPAIDGKEHFRTIEAYEAWLNEMEKLGEETEKETK